MLIGMAGTIESGKTTAADYLNEKYEFSIASYATPLKMACKELTGLPMEYFTDMDLKNESIDLLNGKTSRQLMQMFGTEFVRNMINPDFWIDRMRNKLTTGNTSLNITSGYNVVIDDVRFANEAKLIRDLGGKVIYIFRGDSKLPTHASEQMDFPIDFTVDNNFSKTVLYNQLKSFMGMI